MEQRTQKQLIIGLIFVLIIGVIGYGFVDYFFLTEPTCFDNVQNGKEDGVDCGLFACGVTCEPAIVPLSIVSQKLIEVRPGDYDFIAQIHNPNSLLGASRVRYELNLGAVKTTGAFFILPGQTRFVIIPGIHADGGVLSGASIDITEAEWQKVESFENINFPVQRKNYTVVDRNGVFSELEAVILNSSDFDFDKVEVGVILFSTGGEIVAVNRTDIRTFLSRTERSFKVSWPAELPESVRQDIEVLTNVFENANFIRRYGTQERFQKYY
ncbi:MAG: hypothetical protein HYX22_02075 [Candidatus Yanofskybacteria bacterium]|nr:hypothetical protein [Candidatus Yanofskybacteria bacterium]